eukprot:2284_1
MHNKMKNNKSNRLNVPQQTDIPSDSTTIAETDDTTNNPKVARSVSQLFHGTRKWGSFSKSTINKKKNSILGGIDASSINIASLSTEEYNNHNGFCHFLNFLPILHPVGPLRCSWDAIVMIMLVYTSIEIPYTLAFEIDLTLDDTFGIIAFSIDLILCIDIIFNFRTAYFDKFDTLKLIINPTIIAKKYLRGWFAIDLVTSIPLEFIIPLANNVTTYVKILRVFRLVRVVKILRLLKIMKLFDRVMERIVVRGMLVAARLFKVIALMMLTSHISACIWYFVGCQTQKQYGKSWLSEHTDLIHGCDAGAHTADLSPMIARYSYALYWSVVTLFTTGYGDITATNIWEQWVASISILVGTCFFAYFIGTLTTLISEGDRISSEIMSKMEEAQHFCDKKKLPHEMTRAVLTHTRYHCNYNCILNEQSVLAKLPPYLQTEISLHVYKTLMLSKIDFFNESILDPVVRGAIAIRMRSMSCNNNFRLFKKGDLAKQIYVQRTGRSIHLIETKKGKKMKKKLNRGDVCGEYSLILKKRASTVLCATWCEFYVIDTDDIKEVLQHYYGDRWQKKWMKMKQFVKTEYVKPKSRWRKKRHIPLTRFSTTPSSKLGSDDDEMYEVRRGNVRTFQSTIRSTIRSENGKDRAMFQNIFNADLDDLNHLDDTMHKYREYSDIEEEVAPNKSNSELDSNHRHMDTPTTPPEYGEFIKLDITEQDRTRDASHSMNRAHTTSTIDHIRAGEMKAPERANTEKRTTLNVTNTQKKLKKKKSKSWFVSARQNSTLRDKAVTADTMNAASIREMCADYASDSEGETPEMDPRAKSDYKPRSISPLNDPQLDNVYVSAPPVMARRKKQHRKHRKQTEKVEMTKHNKPPNIVVEMKTTSDDEFVDTDNTDSMPMVDGGSSSSNTIGSQEIPPRTTQPSQHKTKHKAVTGSKRKHDFVQDVEKSINEGANEKDKNEDNDYGFVTMSQMEADMLINKSLRLTPHKYRNDNEIEEQKDVDHVELSEEDEQYANRQVTVRFKD